MPKYTTVQRLKTVIISDTVDETVITERNTVELGLVVILQYIMKRKKEKGKNRFRPTQDLDKINRIYSTVQYCIALH
jgi:hypothetical protein